MSKTYKIAVFAGDGIGPEVTREALKVLDVTAEMAGFKVDCKHFPHGSEHYLETGELLPDEVLEEVRGMDAVYLGAIGDPRVEVGLAERAVIAGLRFNLDLFVNLRPIRLMADKFCPLKGKTSKDVDFVVVRENTEDAYAGIGGILKKGTPHEVAMQQMVYTRHGVERVVRYAYETARKRDRQKKLLLVDKANAIRAQDIWTRTFAEVGEEFPDIEQDHAYVDAACMWMIKNPESFDTVVTTNLFGDIITDLGAVLQGGMGVAASGNINPGQVSLFEPIHGSAPKYKGQNVSCPIAAIAAVYMMLHELGEISSASKIEHAIEKVLNREDVNSVSASSGVSTDEWGDRVIEALRQL
ncbi:MAG: 3-isopropylmalate dehydrogenase [Planctomycetia bacterium]|nr:3-isopropylmalate dehydrogenase [Planctomycetia bacterium]MBL6915321.1 3-isopropylmalate dehydrogenase [Planctomycetota bacterium]